MQSKINSLEEGKDHTITNKPKGLPIKFILILSIFFILCFILSYINLNTFRHIGFDNVIEAVNPNNYYNNNNSYYNYYNYDNNILCSSGKSSNLDDIIKPLNLMHKMSDEELYWRATFEPRIKKYPFNRIPKIAFMFLCKGPLPLAPLWERFFSGFEGRFSVYVHSMPGFVEDFPSTSVFYGRNIPSKVAEWGQMSMCDAEKRLLANALLDISNERFMLLSESCIPLYNFSVIYDYITGSKYSFIGVIDELGRDGRGRYNENMAPEVNLTEWRKGSQWFEINRRLAINVVEDTTFYPKFKEFCKPNCYVDEHYFPTMLSIRSANLLANRSITFVDWSRGGAHPATFGREDITRDFLKRIANAKTCEYNGGSSSICDLFARKFAPSTLEPLLELSPEVLGY